MSGSHTAGELRAPAYERIWAGARRAMERTGGEVSGTFTLTSASADETRALHALLGRSSARVFIADLDTALHAAVGCGLAEWLAAIGGPLRDRPAEREDRAARLAATERVASDHALASEPWFEEWLAGLKADGTIAKAAARRDDRPDLAAALELLAAVLPGQLDRVPLATLAASVTGDTKRLTSATVRAIVERALALNADIERPRDSRDRRLLWRRFGVVIDDVSSDVLVLNLRTRGEGLLNGWLRSAAEVGEPFRVTLRQLASAVVHVDAPVVRVCENPAVVMDVAGRLGPASEPLLCTEGVPSDAFWELAGSLMTGAGTEMRVHADFDAAGCTIASAVMARLGARPWRFDAAAYLDALARFGPMMSLPASKGHVPPTPWDPTLASALAADGRAVYEELVIDTLMADLARPA